MRKRTIILLFLVFIFILILFLIQQHNNLTRISISTAQTTTLPTQPSCQLKSQGDADCNGKIDLVDFEIWRKEATGALTTKNANFNPSVDSAVNIVDFEIWRKGFFSLSPTNSPTRTPTPLVSRNPTPTGSTTNTKILCDGKTFDGFSSTVFRMNPGTDPDYTNPSVQKIIRNCTFQNAAPRPIIIEDAKNILIENSTFYNIRTNTPGKGTHGISFSPDSNQAVDNVIIRNNAFRFIGADGIQVDEGLSDKTSNVLIENNLFEGSDAVGENAVDVKGAIGPIVIRGNKAFGFRPCESPKKGGNQDCSGSPGEGMVIHAATSGTPHNVTLDNNVFENNITGLVVSNAGNNIVVKNNNFVSNKNIGLLISNTSGVKVFGNQYTGNPTNCQNVNPCQ